MAITVGATLNLVINSQSIGPAISTIEKSFASRKIPLQVELQIPKDIDRQIYRVSNAFRTLDDRMRSLKFSSQEALGGIEKFIMQISGGTSGLYKNLIPATKSLDQTAKSMSNLVEQTKPAKEEAGGLAEAIGVSAKRFASFAIAAGVIANVVFQFQKGTDAALQFDRELVRLKQVGGDSQGVIDGIAKEVSNLAKNFGVSSGELIKTATTLRQAGLSASETKIALDALAKTSLAPTFDSIGNTTEGVVAILAQFGQGAGALEKQLGSINRVAADFAVESGDIVEAIRRTGGAFKAAGGNLNELLALFTSVRATTRESAESIATSFRTIFARLQQPDIVKNLRSVGVELTNLKGEFVGPYEAVKRLSDGLAGLPTNSTQFAKIVEDIGGIRQISKVIPLIQQFPLAIQAMNSAIKGESSLSKDAAIAQEAFINKINQLKESFLELFRVVIANEGFRSFLSLILDITKGVTGLISTIKPLIPLLTAAAVVKLGFTGATAFGDFKRGFGKRGFASGGVFQGNGVVPNIPNSGVRVGTDTVPASLNTGDFVIKKSSTDKIGTNNLDNMMMRANGGVIESNSILTPKEYVVPAKKAKEIGYSNLKHMNSTGEIPGYADGGVVAKVKNSNKAAMLALTTRSGDANQKANIVIPKQKLNQQIIATLPEDVSAVSADFTVAGPSSNFETEVINKTFKKSIKTAITTIARRAFGTDISKVDDSIYDKVIDRSGQGRMFEAVLQSIAGTKDIASNNEIFDFPGGVKGDLAQIFPAAKGKIADAKLADNRKSQIGMVSKMLRHPEVFSVDSKDKLDKSYDELRIENDNAIKTYADKKGIGLNQEVKEQIRGIIGTDVVPLERSPKKPKVKTTLADGGIFSSKSPNKIGQLQSLLDDLGIDIKASNLVRKVYTKGTTPGQGGSYSPLTNTISVKNLDPEALLHEFGHAIDSSALESKTGEKSYDKSYKVASNTIPEFKKVANIHSKTFEKSEKSVLGGVGLKRYTEQVRGPESFANAFATYAIHKGVKNEKLDPDDFQGYKNYQESKPKDVASIEKHFDKIIPQLKDVKYIPGDKKNPILVTERKGLAERFKLARKSVSLLSKRFAGGVFEGHGVVPDMPNSGIRIGTDTVPATLNKGDFVIKKSSTDKIGAGNLDKLVASASGGTINNIQSNNVNSILTPNEYVIPANKAKDIGYDNLHHMNKTGEIPGYAGGGTVNNISNNKTFCYETVNQAGKEVKGEVSAKSEKEVVKTLENNKLIISKIYEKKSGTVGGSISNNTYSYGDAVRTNKENSIYNNTNHYSEGGTDKSSRIINKYAVGGNVSFYAKGGNVVKKHNKAIKNVDNFINTYRSYEYGDQVKSLSNAGSSTNTYSHGDYVNTEYRGDVSSNKYNYGGDVTISKDIGYSHGGVEKRKKKFADGSPVSSSLKTYTVGGPINTEYQGDVSSYSKGGSVVNKKDRTTKNSNKYINTSMTHGYNIGGNVYNINSYSGGGVDSRKKNFSDGSAVSNSLKTYSIGGEVSNKKYNYSIGGNVSLSSMHSVDNEKKLTTAGSIYNKGGDVANNVRSYAIGGSPVSAPYQGDVSTNKYSYESGGDVFSPHNYDVGGNVSLSSMKSVDNFNKLTTAGSSTSTHSQGGSVNNLSMGGPQTYNVNKYDIGGTYENVIDNSKHKKSYPLARYSYGGSSIINNKTSTYAVGGLVSDNKYSYGGLTQNSSNTSLSKYNIGGVLSPHNSYSDGDVVNNKKYTYGGNVSNLSSGGSPYENVTDYTKKKTHKLAKYFSGGPVYKYSMGGDVYNKTSSYSDGGVTDNSPYENVTSYAPKKSYKLAKYNIGGDVYKIGGNLHASGGPVKNQYGGQTNNNAEKNSYHTSLSEYADGGPVNNISKYNFGGNVNESKVNSYAVGGSIHTHADGGVTNNSPYENVTSYAPKKSYKLARYNIGGNVVNKYSYGGQVNTPILSRVINNSDSRGDTSSANYANGGTYENVTSYAPKKSYKLARYSIGGDVNNINTYSDGGDTYNKKYYSFSGNLVKPVPNPINITSRVEAPGLESKSMKPQRFSTIESKKEWYKKYRQLRDARKRFAPNVFAKIVGKDPLFSKLGFSMGGVFGRGIKITGGGMAVHGGRYEGGGVADTTQKNKPWDIFAPSLRDDPRNRLSKKIKKLGGLSSMYRDRLAIGKYPVSMKTKGYASGGIISKTSNDYSGNDISNTEYGGDINKYSSGGSVSTHNIPTYSYGGNVVQPLASGGDVDYKNMHPIDLYAEAIVSPIKTLGAVFTSLVGIFRTGSVSFKDLNQQLSKVNQSYSQTRSPEVDHRPVLEQVGLQKASKNPERIFQGGAQTFSFDSGSSKDPNDAISGRFNSGQNEVFNGANPIAVQQPQLLGYKYQAQEKSTGNLVEASIPANSDKEAIKAAKALGHSVIALEPIFSQVTATLEEGHRPSGKRPDFVGRVQPGRVVNEVSTNRKGETVNEDILALDEPISKKHLREAERHGTAPSLPEPISDKDQRKQDFLTQKKSREEREKIDRGTTTREQRKQTAEEQFGQIKRGGSPAQNEAYLKQVEESTKSEAESKKKSVGIVKSASDEQAVSTTESAKKVADAQKVAAQTVTKSSAQLTEGIVNFSHENSKVVARVVQGGKVHTFESENRYSKPKAFENRVSKLKDRGFDVEDLVSGRGGFKPVDTFSETQKPQGRISKIGSKIKEHSSVATFAALAALPYIQENLTGTAEKPGFYGQTGAKTGAGITGALEGAGLGAAVGSSIGPLGTAVGAVVGALGGLVVGLQGFEKELDNIASQKLSESLGKLEIDPKTGKPTSSIAASDVQTGFSKIKDIELLLNPKERQKAFAKEEKDNRESEAQSGTPFGAIRDYFKYGYGKDSPINITGKREGESGTQERINNAFSKATVHSSELIDISKRLITANPNKSIEEIDKKGPKIFGLGITKYLEQIGDSKSVSVIKEFKAEIQKSADVQKKLIGIQEQSYLSLRDMNTALEIFGDVLEKAGDQYQKSTNFNSVGSEALRGKVSAGSTNPSLNLFGEFGKNLESFAKPGGQLDESKADISKAIGIALAANRTGGGETNDLETSSGQAKVNFESVSPKTSFTPKIGDAIRDVLSNHFANTAKTTDKVGEEGLQGKLTEEVLGRFSNAKTSRNSFSKQLESGFQSYNQQIGAFAERRSARVQKGVELKNRGEDFKFQNKQIQEEALGNPTRFTRNGTISSAQLEAKAGVEKAKSEKNNQLESLGISPITKSSGKKAEDLEKRIGTANQQLERAKSQQASAGNIPDYQKATQKIVDLTNTIGNLKKGMDILANSTSVLESKNKLAALAVEKLKGDLEGRKADADVLTFGTAEEKQQLRRSEQLAQAYTRDPNTVNYLGDDDKKLLQNRLESQPDRARSYEIRDHYERFRGYGARTGGEAKEFGQAPLVAAIANDPARDLLRKRAKFAQGEVEIEQGNLNRAGQAVQRVERQDEAGQRKSIDNNFAKYIKDINDGITKNAEVFKDFSVAANKLAASMDNFVAKGPIVPDNIMLTNNSNINVNLTGNDVAKQLTDTELLRVANIVARKMASRGFINEQTPARA